MDREASARIVRRSYHGFNTADRKLLAEVFDAQSTWETPGHTSIAGICRGRDNIFGHFGRYCADTVGSFKSELLYVVADGAGRAVGVHRNTGLRNGKKLDVLCCITFEVANGHIISGKEHFFDLYSWDEFWS